MHAEALSVLSVHHCGTFELTDLTLALCGRSSLGGGGNPYSCHIGSQVFTELHQMYELLFFSAAQYRNAHIPSSPLIGFVALLVCQLVAHRESYFLDNPSRRHHWLSATSTQQVVLFAAEFRLAVSWRYRGIRGTESLSIFACDYY